MGYAIIRIKSGATVSLDFRCFKWPLSDYEMPSGENAADAFNVKDNDMLFVAERVANKDGCYWDATAPNFGGDPYGNGSIFVTGEVEMITPMLGYKPNLEDYEAD